MATEYFHSGSTYSTDPKYNSLFSKGNVYGNSWAKDVHSNFSELSSATDPRGANQLKEASETLNTGIKHIEVGSIQPNVFEAIPTQHFKEMNSMARLAGADISLHAPMVDPTGITQQGWDKLAQQAAEKQLWDAIQKGHTLNPKNQVITFHATTALPIGAEIRVKDEKATGDEKDKGRPVSMIFINEADGKISQIKEEEKYFGTKNGKPIKFDPQKELDTINEEQWMSRISNVNFSAQRADSAIREAAKILDDPMYSKDKEALKELKDSTGKTLIETFEMGERELNHGKLFLREAYRGTKELFDDIYKKASEEEQKKLRKYAEEISPFIEKWKDINDPKELKHFGDVIEEGLKVMGDMKPQIFKPIREFAIEKAAETTSNLAFRAYNEWTKKGETAPILALENHPAQQALLTTGEDLRDVVKKSHELFVKKATEQGMSESEAKKQAEKLIGVTWDVGHINMMRKYGFDEGYLKKQTEAVAPFVKKVHLADNFGFEHTELPMGMGNVPIKAMSEIIAKAQKGEEGYKDIKKVIEAGDWWQHFSGNSKANGPLMPTLAGMGAYVTGNTGWNQMYGIPGAYFSGYGTMLPENNFQTYGAGFMSLPTELGGQMPQGKDRFSGTPMA
jgi:hypothetical protein